GCRCRCRWRGAALCRGRRPACRLPPALPLPTRRRRRWPRTEGHAAMEPLPGGATPSSPGAAGLAHLFPEAAAGRLVAPRSLQPAREPAMAFDSLRRGHVRRAGSPPSSPTLPRFHASTLPPSRPIHAFLWSLLLPASPPCRPIGGSGRV
ncbi:hypothetical protein BS50DRAFT_643505, partial [Corynespora cassiicola Philippines]